MYKIENLTEEHLKVLVKALDFYSRIQMGQLVEMPTIFRFEKKIDFEKTDYYIKELKNLIFPELSQYGYHGIFSEEIPESARIAWDIQQVIRNRIAWDNKPEGGFQVDFDKPYKSSQLELPKIEREENG